ncbi:hypothetical protein DC522_15500 [Microvirga sp. KLBC 81]|nr:hypothetical protein DC522_15500 [Microvirga sp. KLBC 81]
MDTAYFAIGTIATIGSGDFVPKPAAGMIFAIANVMSGIGILVAAGPNCQAIVLFGQAGCPV